MKKLISKILAVSMILTTLILPVSKASAEDTFSPTLKTGETLLYKNGFDGDDLGDVSNSIRNGFYKSTTSNVNLVNGKDGYGVLPTYPDVRNLSQYHMTYRFPADDTITEGVYHIKFSMRVELV